MTELLIAAVGLPFILGVAFWSNSSRHAAGERLMRRHAREFGLELHDDCARGMFQGRPITLGDPDDPLLVRMPLTGDGLGTLQLIPRRSLEMAPDGPYALPFAKFYDVTPDAPVQLIALLNDDVRDAFARLDGYVALEDGELRASYEPPRGIGKGHLESLSTLAGLLEKRACRPLASRLVDMAMRDPNRDVRMLTTRLLLGMGPRPERDKLATGINSRYSDVALTAAKLAGPTALRRVLKVIADGREPASMRRLALEVLQSYGSWGEAVRSALLVLLRHASGNLLSAALDIFDQHDPGERLVTLLRSRTTGVSSRDRRRMVATIKRATRGRLAGGALALAPERADSGGVSVATDGARGDLELTNDPQ